ncbi:Leucine aminopeptidase 1 [Actinomortierella ambigua]|nr:Leucine aminopeptidase 1 [Actinomortierella ambigua]
MKLTSLALVSLAAASAMAAPAWWEQWTLGGVQRVHDAFAPSAADDGRRLIQVADDKEPVWMNERQRLSLLRNKVNYMDITDAQDLGAQRASLMNAKKPLPKTLVQQRRYGKYVDNLSTASMEVHLKEFTTFKTRYYKSPSGYESAKWLYKTINDLIEESDAADVSVRRFKHDGWDQFSIIARFDGQDDSLANEPVIIGAHQDSVNMWLPMWGRSPGADDDGSGTVTILEVFRALVQKGFRPHRPVEFHWYSGEEAGLLGSQAVAKEYEKKNVDVIAMIQNDMTGYIGTKFKEAYGIVVDYVDPELTDFVRKLAREYGDIPIRETKCGYACSDHASWAKAGYRSAFAIEGDFSDSNPYIHSSSDDISHISFDHMKQFAKLSLGFALELGYFKNPTDEEIF